MVAGSLGSVAGSLLSYGMGRLGEPVVLRYGRYLLLNVHHLEWTKKFFDRHGGKTIFISRFIPVVRHLISIPAGLARMSLVAVSGLYGGGRHPVERLPHLPGGAPQGKLVDYSALYPHPGLLHRGWFGGGGGLFFLDAQTLPRSRMSTDPTGAPLAEPDAHQPRAPEAASGSHHQPGAGGVGRTRLSPGYSDLHLAGLSFSLPPGQRHRSAPVPLELRLAGGHLGRPGHHPGGPGHRGALCGGGPGKAHRLGGRDGPGPGLVRLPASPGAHRRGYPPGGGGERGRHLQVLFPGRGQP